MNFQYRFDKLMKKIGAYTISDEEIDLAQIYRSLPSDWRKLLDYLDAGLSIEAAAKRLGIDVEQARDLLDQTDQWVARSTRSPNSTSDVLSGPGVAIEKPVS